MDPNIYDGIIPSNYLSIANDATKSRDKLIKLLFEQKKIPDNGWDDITIEQLVNSLAAMDSNNFIQKCGVGEREGRIICNLVARRHYSFAHGIGRSGDLFEPQPKAAGSSIMATLTNYLLLDLLKLVGIKSTKKCVLVPMATGMTISLCFLSLKLKKPNAKYVLWSRIDQKSCFKSIVISGLIPVIIDPILKDYELITNTTIFEEKIKELGIENILCVFSTTSCFAPRSCDNIIELSQICQKYNLFHVINNAYGLQSTYITHQIEQGNRLGRIDYFIQSTDKNILVPVGGAIVAGFTEEIIDSFTKSYAGRSSSSQTLDVFITLLSLGRLGYKNLIEKRKENFQYLKENLFKISNEYNEELYESKHNTISIGMTLKNLNKDDLSLVGSMLYTRGVSGSRIVSLLENKKIEGYEFLKWGCHSKDIDTPYITVASALGLEKCEINLFAKKFVAVLKKVNCKEKCPL